MLILICIPALFSYGFFGQTTSDHLDSSESKNVIQEFDGSPLKAGTNDGQQVIDYFRTVFESDWNRGLLYDQVEDDIGFPQSRDLYGSSYTPYPSQQLSDEMVITPILSPDNAEEKIIELINSANNTLFIEQMYIYSDLVEISNAIIAASSRGVNCCVIVGDSNDASNETAFLFSQNGIDVKICDGTVPMYFEQHNKGVIVDAEIVLISSINWSPTSLRDNREAGLIIQNTQVANYYQTLFNHDWNVCDPYSSNESFKGMTPISARIEIIPLETPVVADYSPEFVEAPAFSGNMTVQLMASPDNCFAEVAAILESANTSIDISVYTLSSPYLLDILAAKLAAGVNLRLLLERYQVGSYERAYNRHAMYNLTVLGIPLLTTPTANATASGKWADNDFSFQHSKYAIIDNQTLILSSGNWGRSSCPKPQPDGDVDGNRDWWFAIFGKDPTDLPIVTIPPIPSAFNLTSNADSLDEDGYFILSWGASNTATNYSVYQYDGFIDEINGSLATLATETTDLTFNIADLSDGTYYFIVVAKNAYGETLSNCIKIEVDNFSIPGYNTFLMILSMFGFVLIYGKKKIKQANPHRNDL